MQRSCKYSFPTNKREYCGPKNAFKDFSKFISGQEKKEKIILVIKKFPILYAYYDFIGKKLGVRPFDEKVITYYWLSSGKKFSKKDILLFVLKRLAKKGLSKRRAKKLLKKIPNKAKLDHAFHVLVINFITKKVKKTMENYSNCLVMPAKVVEHRAEKVFVNVLRLSNAGFVWRKKFVENQFHLHLRKGNLVSVHWNNIIEKISKSTAKRLQEAIKEKLPA